MRTVHSSVLRRCSAIEAICEPSSRSLYTGRGTTSSSAGAGSADPHPDAEPSLSRRGVAPDLERLEREEKAAFSRGEGEGPRRVPDEADDAVRTMGGGS